MRILIGSISFYPNLSGVAISTHLLAKHLAAKGHEVIIVTSNFGFRPTVEYDKQNKLTIYRLRSFPNPVRKGFFIPFLPAGPVRRIIREVKPDIIHLQDPLRMCRAIRYVAQDENIPTLITNHFTLTYLLTYVPSFLRPFGHAFLTKKLADFYNECTAITCPTETVRDLLHKMGVTKPVYALSNGVDTHRFYSFSSLQPLRSRYHLPTLPLVLYVGRLDKEKSLGTLIKAIPDVLKETPAHFVLAGGGNSAKHIARLVKKAGLEGKVTLTGPISYADDTLVALYQAAALFVMPSPLETQSIVTLEAMAAGKPIVAADTGALPELVHNGENGLLFQANNSRDLARKLTVLLQDEKQRLQMSEKSLELAADHELETALNLYEQVYSNICPTPGMARLNTADTLS